MANLDIEIIDLEVNLLDFNIFSNNGFLIQIKGYLAELASLAISQLLDNLGLAILLPQYPIRLGMLNDILNILKIPIAAGVEPLDIGSMLNADFSAMNEAVRLGGFFGDENRFGLSLDLNTWVRDDKVDGKNYHDYDEVIHLPPTISINGALKPSEGVDPEISLAISSDTINRVLTAVADMELEFSMPATDLVQALVPGIQLPDNTVSKISFNSPPVVDFSEGKSQILVPNLVIDTYMNSVDMDGLQLSMALDIIADICAEILLYEDDYYLSFDLSLNEFNVFYLTDKMGIHQLLDVEHVIDIIMPQVMDIIKALLNIPFAINYSDILQVSWLFYDMPIPEFNSITIPEIRMDGGYVSLFIDIN